MFVAPGSLSLSSGVQSINWVVRALERFCLEGQVRAKCPCCPQVKHAPCMSLCALVSSVLTTFPLVCPPPRPRQFPLGVRIRSTSIGTGWLFHARGAVLEL